MNKNFLWLFTILAIFIFPNCQVGNFADDPLNIPQWDGGTEAGNPPPAAVGDQPVITRRNGEVSCPEELKNPETGLCEFLESSSLGDLPHGAINRFPPLNQIDLPTHPVATTDLHLSDLYRKIPTFLDQDDEECVVCPILDKPETFDEGPIEDFEEESEGEYDEDLEGTEESYNSPLDTNAIRAVTPPVMIKLRCCNEEEN